MNAKGEFAAHTGPRATAWAGDKQGKFCTAQGNILAGPDVVARMVAGVRAVGDARRRTPAPHISLRLVAALEAGQAAGGDTRGQQSAALIVVKKDAGVWLQQRRRAAPAGRRQSRADRRAAVGSSRERRQIGVEAALVLPRDSGSVSRIRSSCCSAALLSPRRSRGCCPPASSIAATMPRPAATVVVAGTYHRVDAAPVGPFAAVVAVPRGFIEAADVVAVILFVGGAWVVVDRLGTLGRLVAALVGALPAAAVCSPFPSSSLFFAAMGALENMQEEIIPLVPVLLLLGARSRRRRGDGRRDERRRGDDRQRVRSDQSVSGRHRDEAGGAAADVRRRCCGSRCSSVGVRAVDRRGRCDMRRRRRGVEPPAAAACGGRRRRPASTGAISAIFAVDARADGRLRLRRAGAGAGDSTSCQRASSSRASPPGCSAASVSAAR